MSLRRVKENGYSVSEYKLKLDSEIRTLMFLCKHPLNKHEAYSNKNK